MKPASNGANGRCAVAIVGVAGRFPGAADVRAFWNNLRAGVESISVLDEAELEDDFPASVRSQKTFVPARSILTGAENFDAGFFGMHARDAELTDPQQRVFLECCWESLEDAGYDPASYPGTIGVVGGCSINSYLLRNVLGNPTAVRQFTDNYQVDDVATLIGGGSDFLATRVAYKLDLRGPALTVQSACSTSLLAVAQGAQALMLGQADLMLAGAVSISFPQKRGYVYLDGGMVSPDGHCRTFDAEAQGTVFGAGAGVIVLKRLDDALRDGDAVYAVIRGFGINNDGSAKVGYTAPSAAGQTAAIAAAHAMAGFDPRSIRYVECHGTATPLGDPIEIAALTKAFAMGTNERNFCAVGSVKPNVGHLDAAAGMAGLIKTVLCIREGEIPPTLHFKQPNPRIDFERSPFYVNARLSIWPQDDPFRRAGVSAFGIGGTNVHLVLEAAPSHSRAPSAEAAQLLVLSARSEAALGSACGRLAEHLRGADSSELDDVAFTLQTGRRVFPFRFAVSAHTTAQAAAKLERFAERAAGARRALEREQAVAFMFPGQGAQYIGMGSGLYERLSAFREPFDRCAEILKRGVGLDLHSLVYPQGASTASSEVLKQTAIAQPALFAVEYALARTWMRWGIAPAAMIGHSVGEFVAAALSGVLSLEDALLAVAERGRLMQALPAGGMLAVRLREDEAAGMLTPGLSLAAVNSPALSVVAGPFDELERLERTLVERGVTCRRLETSHAFHSAMVDAAVAPFAERMRGLRFATPAIPYVSCASGEWISDTQATSANYWSKHARTTVRFASGLQTLCESGVTALVEVGPGSALATFAAQGAAREAGCTVVGSLPTHAREYDDLEAMLESLGVLWTTGARPDWQAVHEGSERRRVHLPTYPFERARYWIEPTTAQGHEPLARDPEARSESAQETVIVANGAGNGRDADASKVERDIVQLLEELSGEHVASDDLQASFLQLGFDSLFLGRFVKALSVRFGVSVTFRQLLGELPSIAALRDHLIASTSSSRAAIPAAAPQRPQRVSVEQHPPGDDATARLAAFRPSIASARPELSPAQRAHIDELIARTVARTKRSKELTQQHRASLADPRVAAGFRTEWKEMVYPVTCVRAKGSRLWDVDGNEYIDLLNGFGQTAFGHAPDFVVAAVAEQLRNGFAIGPQTDLAGEAAALLCELTNNERVTFCNTGSEAVMAALRVARTVAGRANIVMFEGSYHGQFDEVLVKGARTSHRALPIAPGIPPEAVSNVTVLPYGEAASLAWIRENAPSLCAVLVEPVQSRHPALQPRAFLHELRAITQAAGTALIFDEVVTGFRVHPGGAQALFDVRADLTTYGKVIGGGMPIGILAGNAAFMDALDGGMWQYGDDSIPEVAPTFVAGTFVRHPLAMAAVVAVLRHLRERGPQLQAELSERTDGLVARLNAALARRMLRSRIESFGSIMFFNFASEGPFANLLFFHLRARGVYVQEGFPCFLTTEHSQGDVDAVVEAFEASLDALVSAGILLPAARAVKPTESQTEIWLVAQLGDLASCAFNESLTMRLEGVLDERAFASSWNALVARHEALRASFSSTGETMRIDGPAQLAYDMVDLRGTGDPEAALAALVAAEAKNPFDLVAGPLVRGRLVRLTETTHAFILSAHHIVCDGWSINVLLDEFAALYTGYANGTPVTLGTPSAFSAYANSQHATDPLELARVEAYWRGQFAQPPSVLDLPTDRPRPRLKSFSGATRSLRVDRSETAALKAAGARNGCTLFVTLLASFSALLGRLAEQRDVVIGIPAAGQSLLEDGTLVGHCVNLLPIRATWAEDSSLRELMLSTKQRVLEGYEHQGYTLGTLVRNLALARESNRTPLAEVQFNLERISERLHLPALSAEVVPNAKAAANFDLFLNVVESEDGLRLDCDYNTDLFDAATIDRWLECYRSMLRATVEDPDSAVARANFVPPQELSVLSALNDTTRAYASDASLASLFEAQAAAQPDTIAVMCGDEQLTYGELEWRANRLAHRLYAAAGAPGALVGVCVERSADMLVALLATLKAGCAYVPLDPAHPPARLRSILTAASVAVLVTTGAAAGLAPAGATVVDLESEADALRALPSESLGLTIPCEHLAYVVFTSGSTGMPKGVEVTQRSVVNLLAAMAHAPGIARADVLVAVTTLAFDIAALELLLPLTAGARVVIAQTAEVQDGFRLLGCIERSAATIVQATPATWRMLLDAGFHSHPALKMLCGGEALSRELASELLNGGGELWNMYGPTETTIWSACKRIASDAAIAVGKPIANTQFHVLDRHGERVPLGKPGELYIGGDGLARGYLAQPELTAERFVPNRFGAGRLYRTGDVARVLAQGDVEILGRADQQVKVRGFRVELGEIELRMNALAGVAGAAVALRKATGHPQLVGYYVEAPGASLTAASLRRGLAEHLPEYMIPSAWVRLAALPRLPNGKLDRAALGSMSVIVEREEEYVAPRTALERTLCEIWTEVLQRERIGITDDIFALGADSIQLFKITARANRQGISLMAKALFTHRTIAAVVGALDGSQPQLADSERPHLASSA